MGEGVGEQKGGELAVIPPAAPLALHREVNPDQQLITLWLDGRSRHTQRAYRRDATLFLAFVNKPVLEVKLADLQGFAAHVRTLDLVDGSRHRILAAVKSLFAFATLLGYLPFDVARPLRMPSGKDTLNERIIDSDEVQRIIKEETNPRNKLIIRLLYAAGLRVSELVSLRWRDVQAHRDGGQITVFGKGRKTRTIRLEGGIWKALLASRHDAQYDVPVFVSQRGGHLHQSQVLRIVKAAATRSGINKPVSSHWLRHCHASHALDRGSPLHLVQQTLGHSSLATTSRYLHARPSESSSKFLPDEDQ